MTRKDLQNGSVEHGRRVVSVLIYSADMQGILPCEILGLNLDDLVIVMPILLLQQETIGFFSTDFACTSKTIPSHLIAPLVTNNTRVT